MKKYVLFFLVLGLVVLWVRRVCLAGELIWEDISRGNTDVTAVSVNPDNPQIIYAGVKNNLLESRDGGKNWRKILSVKGKNGVINFLGFHPLKRNCLYAASGEGLFFSDNQGKSWRRVFHGKNYLQNYCTVSLALEENIFLGTKGGFFISNDSGRSWRKAEGCPGNFSIFSIAASIKEPGRIYLVSSGGAFRSEDSGKNWQNIFIRHPIEINDAKEEDNDEDVDAPEDACDLRYIAIDPNQPNYLYLVKQKGIYRSSNRGDTWEAVTNFGLLSEDARFLFISHSSDLYLVTKSGIFRYLNNRWQELSLRLIFTEIRYLTGDKRGNLYAACNSGLFKAGADNPLAGEKLDLSKIYSLNEPGIRELQQAAIKYAEVEPEKILRWRKQAGSRALLPKLSAGVNRDTGDLWHWETGSSTKSGDDLLVRGRDSVGWDVTLTWDLGEIIWSSEQTAIDVRSRLNAQLREDILDEVTKLYFERIRVKMELNGISLEERKKISEKELRLEELTAYLDGFTGGYFSRKTKTGSAS